MHMPQKPSSSHCPITNTGLESNSPGWHCLLLDSMVVVICLAVSTMTTDLYQRLSTVRTFAFFGLSWYSTAANGIANVFRHNNFCSSQQVSFSLRSCLEDSVFVRLIWADMIVLATESQRTAHSCQNSVENLQFCGTVPILHSTVQYITVQYSKIRWDELCTSEK